MKPYDKSNSFVRRVTKRVSELIPGTTWMNTLLGETQAGDDPSSASENDDQPPVKKLCSLNNANNRTCMSTNPSVNSTDSHRNSHLNVHSPEISAVTCIPSTSKQSPKFMSQSNSSLQGQDNSNSSSKRKSDVLNSTNIRRQCSKTIAFNFASSTPTLVTSNKQPKNINNVKILNSNKLSTNKEYFTSCSSQLIKSRENESQPLLTFRETTTKQHNSSPSFRWDTFVNYGELSERQKLFAQKSPLNCCKVMYGGNSARSNLSKILANTPAIHKKSVIPISPTINNEIRTTSSILLSHISTKDKAIEENKFIIQPKIQTKHKTDKKTTPLKIESTVKIDNTISIEGTNDNSNDNLSKCSVRDTSRKLRANISKKARGLKSVEELEMPAKVDLPNISLPVPVLPSIKLSNDIDEDNEFSFNQPLTIEQFSLQMAEKSCKKQQKLTLKKTPNSNLKSIKKDNYSKKFSVLSSPINNFTPETSKEENQEISIMKKNDKKVENLNVNDNISQLSKFGDNDSEFNFNKPIPCVESKLHPTKSISGNINNEQVQNLNEINNTSQKLSVEKQKSWTCDGCWVPNSSDKTNCIACQTPRPTNFQQPLKVVKSSTWTCETCWVPNKNEIDSCVACQTQKPGTIQKVEQIKDWKCDTCWVTNKTECTSCISCGTGRSGLVPDTKPQLSTQFKFGLNNSFDKSGGTSFKFGFDSSKTDQSSSQYQFGNALQTQENGKSDTSSKEFKFGMVNNKADESFGTFKFGIDNSTNHLVKNTSEVLNSNDDQPSDQFKFGLNSTNSLPITQFKFGSVTAETEKSVQLNFAADNNKIPQYTNELHVNNENKVFDKSIELKKNSEFKFSDTKEIEKSPQITFGPVETHYNNSNSSINIEHKKNDQSKGGHSIWDKKDKIEIKSVNFGTPQTIQSSIENTNVTQLVNGHSHSNETLSEDGKPGLIKTSQLFTFGSLAKQDQNLPDDRKTSFTFGSTANDNKTFVSPLLSSSSFPTNVPVFGATNSIFGNVNTTSTQGTQGSNLPASKFSFSSMAPPTSNSFFSKTTKDDDKKLFPQTSNSFSSAANINFSFGTPSTPVFSVASTTTGGLMKPVEANDQFKSTPNNIFNQSSTKKTVKLDPNAPISINFTSGTTTQFTANPDTTEPPAKRKILKPVRRIR